LKNWAKLNPAAELHTVWKGKVNFADRICKIYSIVLANPAFFGLVNPKQLENLCESSCT
jgi:hypothetical protein